MFYRRQVILSILQIFDGKLEKIALQKLLFLFTKRQNKPDYDFIPYQYGCYSISANADLETMVKKNILVDGITSFIKNDKFDYISKLTIFDKKILQDVKLDYGKCNSKALTILTYLNYGYYAINSKVAKDLLTFEQYQKIQLFKPKKENITLYTIGYEGISLEEYLNKLIKNDIKTLVDVRCNPSSMKFGFSKSQLQKYCTNLNISYIHIPEVGIKTEFRQNLNVQSDYDLLFDNYKKTVLRDTKTFQIKILDLLKLNNRIALTCFEANICQCHRKHLAEAITNLPDWNFELKHI